MKKIWKKRSPASDAVAVTEPAVEDDANRKRGGSAQPDLQPMDSTVVLERDRERPRGDLHAIKFSGRDAALHALRILDHDLEPRGAVPKHYLETGPGPWNARVETQCTALDSKAENVLVEGLGYAACSARTGAEALVTLERVPEIGLLFTDILMPDGMNGFELAAETRRRRPDIAILLTSGFSGNFLPGALLRDDFDIIRKPYTQNELAAALSKAM